MYTQTGIALKSLEQIRSLKVSQLKECCKTLELTGYSRLNKIALIDLVFSASDIERQRLVSNDKSQLTASENKNSIARLKRKNVKQKVHPINIEVINKLLKKGLSTNIIANTLFKLCSDIYTDSTVAKTCTKKLKEVLSSTKLDANEQEALKTNWNKLVYAINYAQKEKEQLLLKSYAREAEKKVDSKELVKWAINHLSVENEYLKGLALSILSGRRMIEIYGVTKYELGTVGILAQGLAKKAKHQNDSCEFITLCDRQEWLDSLNSLKNRNLEKKKVNGSISKLISRHFPSSLKDLDIHKFKDCRDVYAAITYQTFQLVARDAIPFTKEVMGHGKMESTAYYRKYDCEPLEELAGVFKQYTHLT